MKILLMDVNCKYSSTGKIVYDLYTQLKANGHEAGIAYGRGPLVEGENIYRFSPSWEVYLHALLTRLTGYNGCFSHIATRRAIKFIEKFQPDVVHLHDMHGYFVNIIPLMNYLKEKKIKTIWTFHCEYMYTGKCGYAYECERWKTGCGQCSNLKDYPRADFFDKTKQMLEQKKKSFADFNNLTIIVPSEWIKSRVKQSFLKDVAIKVINNGINTKVFYPRETEQLRQQLGVKNEKIVLAVAPNLMSERKGGKFVVEMAEKMKEDNVKFVLVGLLDTNETFAENIVPIGMVSDQDLLAQYYSLADVFVICSKKENYPTSCVEAAACGAYVVGFNEGGTSETVTAQGGAFVEYGDVDALVEQVRNALAAGKKQEKEYSKDYSKEKMYADYLKEYRND